MSFSVLLTEDAAADLDELFEHVATSDSLDRALRLLENIERVVVSLADRPERGTYPRELSDLGIREYRELFFKPYRIVYAIEEDRVHVYLIVDGRRDMRALLERRLLQR